MLNFIEKILIAIFSLLPDADPDNNVLAMVASAIETVKPAFYNIDLIFPILTLFKILMLAIFVEATIFLITLVIKVAVFFRG